MNTSKPCEELDYVKIIFDSARSFKCLFSFLKYSTHINYLPELSEFSYPYWAYTSHNHKLNNKLIGEVMLINKKLAIRKKKESLKTSILNFNNIETLKKNIKCYNDLFLKILDNYNLKICEVDFLIDFEGSLNLLSVTINEGNNKSILLFSDLKESFNLHDFCKDKKIENFKNTFVKAKIKSSDYSNAELQYSFSSMSSDCFDLYGSAGVNIPLIAVMNLMNMKTRTRRTVHQKKIIKIGEEFIYNFSFKNVYIDLDQTLIWHWKDKLIEPIYQFIIYCQNNNIKITLLTRHEKNIENTLNKSKIDSQIFFKIIKVENKQLKSTYITNKDSIFIDDEFNQRMDVYNKTGIPVLDLYQIKYLKKLS